MFSKAESQKSGLICAAVILLLLTGCKGCVVETKPNNERAKREVKPVLDYAHQSAINAVDTIRYDDIFVNVKSASKDSANFTQKMYEVMEGIGGQYTYYDFVCDSSTIRSCGEGCFTYTCSGRFSIKKAMHYKPFAKVYNKYYDAIKKLEIARRQKRNKGSIAYNAR